MIPEAQVLVNFQSIIKKYWIGLSLTRNFKKVSKWPIATNQYIENLCLRLLILWYNCYDPTDPKNCIALVQMNESYGFHLLVPRNPIYFIAHLLQTKRNQAYLRNPSGWSPKINVVDRLLFLYYCDSPQDDISSLVVITIVIHVNEIRFPKL